MGDSKGDRDRAMAWQDDEKKKKKTPQRGRVRGPGKNTDTDTIESWQFVVQLHVHLKFFSCSSDSHTFRNMS